MKSEEMVCTNDGAAVADIKKQIVFEAIKNANKYEALATVLGKVLGYGDFLLTKTGQTLLSQHGVTFLGHILGYKLTVCKKSNDYIECTIQYNVQEYTRSLSRKLVKMPDVDPEHTSLIGTKDEDYTFLLLANELICDIIPFLNDLGDNFFIKNHIIRISIGI